MKKHFLFTAALFAALSFGFSSCENPDDNEELLNRIEQLENQLKDQQSDKDNKDKTETSDDNEPDDPATEQGGSTENSGSEEETQTPDPDEGEGGSSDDSSSNLVPAAFSVSADKQVYFSPGNLQYTQSTNTWSFAENQYDVIGTANVVSDGALADKIDLFGWSGSTGSAKFGVSTSTDIDDYSGSFVDWGSNQIGDDVPNTWRTLTYDEWYYLRYERPNYDKLIGVAQVNGVNGLILLPDAWTCPEGVTFKSGFHSNYGVDYYAVYQIFTADQWSKLESAGAVFLPAAGYRYGFYVYYVQNYGYCWSATEDGSNFAYYLYFDSGEAGMYHNYRYYGRSVRLVKDL